MRRTNANYSKTHPPKHRQDGSAQAETARQTPTTSSWSWDSEADVGGSSKATEAEQEGVDESEEIEEEGWERKEEGGAGGCYGDWIGERKGKKKVWIHLRDESGTNVVEEHGSKN